jgi:hypothetical protein
MKMQNAAPRLAAIAFALAGVACALPQAYAAGEGDAQPAARPSEKFRKLDRNGDGFLDKGEVRHIRGYTDAFDQADGNRDGKLDPSEFIKAESIYERQQIVKYVDDGVLTTKVKAALLKEPNLKSIDVHVETYQGKVLLSGWIDSAAQRERAVKVASSVQGVVAVLDALELKVAK